MPNTNATIKINGGNNSRPTRPVLMSRSICSRVRAR